LSSELLKVAAAGKEEVLGREIDLHAPKAKDTPFPAQLTWMNMLVKPVRLFLLACTAVFIAYDMIHFRDTMVRNLSTQAQIIGSIPPRRALQRSAVGGEYTFVKR